MTQQFITKMELRSYQTELSSHSHDYAQLVLPLKGILELEIAGHGGVINSEVGAFIAPGQAHCFAGSSNNLFLVVDMPAQHRSNFSATVPFLELNGSIKKYVQFTYSYLNRGITDRTTELLMQQLLLQLLNPIDVTEDFVVEKAKNWLNLHFHQPINISELAQYCHFSMSQLQRRFKKNTGYGLAEYWRNKKMEHAKFLLATSAKSVETIALDMGYENASAFCRRFSVHYKLTPSQWRETTLSA